VKNLGISEGEKSWNLKRKISKFQKKRNLGILGEEKSRNLRRRKILGISKQKRFSKSQKKKSQNL
jgi:hypothetical protein